MGEETEEAKDEMKVSKKSITEKVRENPWVLSTFVMGLLIVILLITSSGNLTGKVISENKVGEYLLSYYESMGAEGLTMNSVKKIGDIYEVNLNYQGDVFPFYVTKSGYIMGNQLVSIIPNKTSSDTDTQTTEIPKSDKPVVELFIWGYCPYGVQAQGPLAEVADLLGKYADFRAVLYYDGHGEFETQQNKIQECIQELYPAKYWKYAAGFVEKVYPVCSSARTVDCDKTESVKLMNSLGIDSAKVLSCVSSKGESLISAASDYAKAMSVSGSPTLLINGVKADAERTAEAYKDAVCSAFNEVPEECGTALSSESGTASGNCG